MKIITILAIKLAGLREILEAGIETFRQIDILFRLADRGHRRPQ